ARGAPHRLYVARVHAPARRRSGCRRGQLRIHRAARRRRPLLSDAERRARPAEHRTGRLSRQHHPVTTGAAFAAPTAERLAAEHPEWRGWLGLLDVVAAAARGRVWRDAVPDRIDGRAPALAGATLRVERDAVQRLIEALFTASGVAGLQRAATRTNALE